jgi:four helix bundle protein
MFDFEKLEVYTRMEKVSAEVLRFIFADRSLDPFLKDQLKRAIVSVTLNLAEGSGRMSSADKKHFYAMARSSLFESAALLRILKSQQLMKDIQFEQWYNEMEEVSKMTLKLIQKT